MARFDGAKYLNLTSGVTRLATGVRWLGAEWLLSRALCRYRVFDFAEVPVAKRSAALRLQLAQFAPFAEPGYAVAWEGPAVQVWCWDAALLRDAVSDAGLVAARVRVVPESTYFRPLEDGVRLLRVAEGFEGQVWKSRVLTNARFWAETPDAREWISFQRDAGVVPEAQRLEATPLDLVRDDKPHVRLTNGLQDTSPAAFAEPVLVFALTALLGICTAWYAVAIVKSSGRQDQLTADAKSLESSAAPVLAAREKAIDNDIFTRQLARVSPYPDQLSLLAAVATTYAADNVVLREWNYGQGKVKLLLVYPGATPSVANAVAALQRQPDFVNVRAVPGNDPKSLSISADIKPRFANEESAARS